jgi:hypothetical protein
MNRFFHNYTINIVLLFLLFVASGCKSDITNELKSNYKGDKISITGALSLDSVNLYVGKTTDAFSEVTIDEIEAQQAKAYIEDETRTFHYDLESTNGKLFRAKKIGLQVGKKYKVFASAKDLKSVETDWILIPDAVVVEDLIVRKTAGSYRSPNEITFSFQDKVGINFYFLNIVLKREKLLGTVPSFVPTESESACYDISIFNDICFEGKKATLRYGSFGETNFPSIKGYQLADSIIIRFGGISEQWYKLKLSSNTGDDLIDGINEPPLTYTNVKNGYGVVFAHNLKDYVLLVPK